MVSKNSYDMSMTSVKGRICRTTPHCPMSCRRLRWCLLSVVVWYCHSLGDDGPQGPPLHQQEVVGARHPMQRAQMQSMQLVEYRRSWLQRCWGVRAWFGDN